MSRSTVENVVDAVRAFLMEPDWSANRLIVERTIDHGRRVVVVRMVRDDELETHRQGG